MKTYFHKMILATSCLLLFISNVSGQTQNVAINNTGNLPDNSAMLDVSATDKGILIPRMSTSQRTAIASPAKGLLVFDNDLSQFWYYNGVIWVALTTGVTGPTGATGPTGPAGSNCVTLDGAYNCGGAGLGRIINANSGAVEVNTSSAASSGFKSTHTNTGVAVNASSTLAGNTFSTIQATTASSSNLVSAILGSSSAAGFGTSGQVLSTGTGQAGVYGNNLRTTGGHGVWGFGYNGTVGESNYVNGYGASGWNHATTDPGIGTFGQGVTGIAGQSTNTTLSYGVYSYDDGGIYNNLDVGGNLAVVGTKSFIIDHPLYPDKYLKHFCMESPEVLNVYRGNVTLDNNGEAIVTLPDYFKAINANFSYQLTAIGSAAPGLFVKNEISDHTFSVAGGKPGMKVSWVVYAERNDEYMKKHPDAKSTEVLKTSKLKKVFHGDAKNDLLLLDGQKQPATPKKQPVLNVLEK